MDPVIVDVAEQKRLNDAREAQIPWKKWGPYLSERQWGTVREPSYVPLRMRRHYLEHLLRLAARHAKAIWDSQHPHIGDY